MNDDARTMKVYGPRDIGKIEALSKVSECDRFALEVVSKVLPFKVNNYVIDELIDWNKAPDDPIFRLTFLQKDLLEPEDFNALAKLVKEGKDSLELQSIVKAIRTRMNPHPSGQLTHNIPQFEGQPVRGVQHKYRETVLVFPAAGQTCFSYCTFCFRWAQFVGDKDLTFATDAKAQHLRYLEAQKQVTDVLLTGGDPMIMRARHLAQSGDPLLQDEFEHIQSIRIGTKVLSYWPYRFTTDRDADDILRLFERIVASGKQLAIMAHINHPRELATPACREAIRRIQATGATIRCQSPLLRHVNDSATIWANMWQEEVRLGCIPYYFFVERDTGPKKYFEVSLEKAHEIFSDAYRQVSGLARTVRGPSMSATPGKVAIEGIAEVAGEKVFILKFLQGRDAAWCGKPFFAKFDPHATWFDQLKPAFGANHFFFEDPKRAISPEVDTAASAPSVAVI